MAQSILIVTVNGIDYDGWKTVEISRDMEEMVGSFNLQLVDLKVGQAVPVILAGDKCIISIRQTDESDPFVVMTGFVEGVSPNMDADKVTFAISGRDRTCDLVDCSVTQASEWKDILFEDFVEDVIRPFGLEVVLDSAVSTGDEIKSINYDEGDKVFELISKHAQLKQLLVYTLPDGRLLITRASTERIEGVEPDDSLAFIQGQNVLTSKANTDWSQVYSEYIVKGSRQSTENDTEEEEATQIEEATKDERISRFRPLIIIPDSEQTNVSAKTRSKWEASIRIGRSSDYSIERQGWQPVLNKLAYLELPYASFAGDMVIKSHRLIADENGKRTEFTFVDPRAFAALEEDSITQDEKDSNMAAILTFTEGNIGIEGGGFI